MSIKTTKIVNVDRVRHFSILNTKNIIRAPTCSNCDYPAPYFTYTVGIKSFGLLPKQFFPKATFPTSTSMY